MSVGCLVAPAVSSRSGAQKFLSCSVFLVIGVHGASGVEIFLSVHEIPLLYLHVAHEEVPFSASVRFSYVVQKRLSLSDVAEVYHSSYLIIFWITRSG